MYRILLILMIGLLQGQQLFEYTPLSGANKRAVHNATIYIVHHSTGDSTQLAEYAGGRAGTYRADSVATGTYKIYVTPRGGSETLVKSNEPFGISVTSVSDTAALQLLNGVHQYASIASGVGVGNYTYYSASGFIANGISVFAAAGAGNWVKNEFATNSGVIYASWAGAMGDGVTVDQAAIEKLINYTKDNATELVLSEGTYVMDAALGVVLYTVPIQISGKGFLDFTGVAPTEVSTQYFTPTYDTTLIGTVTAAIELQDDTFEISSNAGLTVGDYFIIDGTQKWGNRAVYTKGEIHQVKSIAGTTIGIHDYFLDTYKADSATVIKTSPGGSFIKDISLTFTETTGANGKVGLRLKYFNNVSIKDVTIVGADNTALEVLYGKDIRIVGYTSRYSPMTGFGYGSVVSSCQNVFMSNADITEARHAFTLSGTFPSRFIYVNDSYLANGSDWSGALDTHGNGEYIYLQNNTVIGGINIRSSNTLVEGNKIFPRPGGLGISINPDHKPQQGYLTIRNNELHTIGGASTADFIQISLDDAGDTMTTVLISGNENFGNKDSSDFARQLLQITSDQTDNYIEELRIENNKGHKLTDRGIYLINDVDVGDLYIEDNILDNASTSDNPSLQVESWDITNAYIKRNNFDKGVYLNSTATSVYTEYFDNTISDSNASGNRIFWEGNIVKGGNITHVNTFAMNILSDSTFFVADNEECEITFNGLIAANGSAGDTLVLRIFYYLGQGPDELFFGQLRSTIDEDGGSFDQRKYNISEITFYGTNDASADFLEISAVDSVLSSSIATVPMPSYSGVTYATDTGYIDLVLANNYGQQVRYHGVLVKHKHIAKIEVFTQ